MSQLDPTVTDQTAVEFAAPVPAIVAGRRVRIPGWLALMLGNGKSFTGLMIVAFVVVIALIAPWISVSDPNSFSLLDASQAPSWHHLFGTTDQGSDVFSQVVVGARRSLVSSGQAAAALATPQWPRFSASARPTSAAGTTRS